MRLADRLHCQQAMRIAALLVLAVALGACTPADKEQAHQTTEKAKHDAEEAAHKAKIEAEKASREIDKGLHDARNKVRGALDQPPDHPADRK